MKGKKLCTMAASKCGLTGIMLDSRFLGRAEGIQWFSLFDRRRGEADSLRKTYETTLSKLQSSIALGASSIQ